MSKIVECWTGDGKHRAIEMDENNRAFGWVYYKHADGETWVTLRKATEREMESARAYLGVGEFAASPQRT